MTVLIFLGIPGTHTAILDMEYYQNDSGHYLRVYNPEIPVGTANTIKIAGPPQSLPPQFSYLNNCGQDWQAVVLAEMATGFVRFTAFEERLPGRFLTNIWSANSEQAQQLLELPERNQAKYKCRVDAPAGTTLMIGKMTSSPVTQLYIPDTANLIYYDPTAAD